LIAAHTAPHPARHVLQSPHFRLIEALSNLPLIPARGFIRIEFRAWAIPALVTDFPTASAFELDRVRRLQRHEQSNCQRCSK